MPRGTEVAQKATFDTDDKRAQYARLVVFNHGVSQKIISKDKDVNSVSNSDLEKALKDLTGGNMLDGPGGIEVIMKLSAKGSTTGRALTKAYAQEVRPFLRRKSLSPSFGRRAGERKPKADKAPTKAAPSTKKSGRKSSSKSSPTESPAPAPEPSPVVGAEEAGDAEAVASSA